MIHVAILTVSDRSSRGERPDLSGPALAEHIQGLGWKLAANRIVPDEKDQISGTLREWAVNGEIDVILTTGGTGFAPRDVTPEATLAVVERLAPGLSEAMRYYSLQKTPHAMLSRSVCGVLKKCLIINLPGSPRAAVENLQFIESVLPHAIELLHESPHGEAGHASEPSKP